MSRLRDGASRFVAKAQLEEIARLGHVVSVARQAFIERAAEMPAFYLLQTIPYVGKIRAAELTAIVGEPRRFASIRKFWAYAGLAVVRRTSSEYHLENGRPLRKQVSRGLYLNRNRNLRLKKIFRDIALFASLRRGAFRTIYDRHIARGKEPSIARIALARKVAAIVRAVWSSGLEYDASFIEAGNSSVTSIDAAVRS
jgi:transposase